MKKTHTEFFSVRASDCDLYGRLRPDALFVAMQEGGEHHAAELGAGHDAMLERGLFFALTRVHVSVSRPPRCSETVRHTTWPGVCNRFFFPRFHVFTLEDGTPLASCAALWVTLDVNARKIVSPLTIDLGFPDTGDLPVPTAANPRLPTLGENAVQMERAPVYSEFDMNGHVNNTRYIAWLSDAIGKKTLSGAYICDLVASYEKEIREESPMHLLLSRSGNEFAFRVESPSGEKHFSAGCTLATEAL